MSDSFRHHFDCVGDEQIAEIPSHQKKYKSRIEKRKNRLASRSAATISDFRNTEETYPYVTTAAAAQQQQQQQHIRSSGGDGGDGGGGSTASLFFHSCRSSTKRREERPLKIL